MIKKKRLIFGIGGALFVVAIGVTVAVLLLANRPVEVVNDASNEGEVTQELTGLPPTNAEATALVDEAYAAQADGDYDLGIQKLQAAQAIYEAVGVEMYSTDIADQIVMFEEQKVQYEMIEAANQEPVLIEAGE